MRGRLSPGSFRSLSFGALGACVMLFGGCASGRQDTFATPEDAAQSLIASARDGNVSQLERILGPDSRSVIVSGDTVQDRNQREVFVVAADEQWRLEDMGDDQKELVIGYEDWPFPIPIVREDGAWRFDTAAGIDEVIARRIGRNELTAIGLCETYVSAQREYAATGHDGNPAGVYAQRFASTPGMHDGLHWKSTSADDQSPLGALAAVAADEGYTRAHTDRPNPFHGYLFRILTSQTGAAPDGARDYVVDGRMNGGFAMVAFPASYGNTGIMTFIVNQDGVVLQSDLGENAEAIASAMTAFDPTDQWKIVE